MVKTTLKYSNHLKGFLFQKKGSGCTSKTKKSSFNQPPKFSSKSIRSSIKLLLFWPFPSHCLLRSQGGLWDFHLAWKPMEKRELSCYKSSRMRRFLSFERHQILSHTCGRIGLPQEDEEISHIYLYTWNLFVLCFGAEPSPGIHPNEFTLPVKKNSEKDSMQKGQRGF